MNVSRLEFQSIFKTLRKRWPIVATIFCVFFGLAFIVTILSTPIYEGRAQIIIEKAETENLSGSNRFQPLRDPDFQNTQHQLLRSHSVSCRVVELLTVPVVSNETKQPILSEAESVTKNDQIAWTTVDRLAAELSLNIKVQPLPNSNITVISYYSPSPEFAAHAANSYVHAYLQETLDMKLEATRRNLGWMTDKAEAERLKLQESEKRLHNFMVMNNLMTVEDRATVLPGTLSQLGRDLVEAEARTQELRLLYEKVQAVAEDLDAVESVLSTSESAVLDVLREQILKAEQNNMELASKYGAKHPVMVKAIADLDALKDKRRNEISRIIQKIVNQYNLARENENSLRSRLNRTKSDSLGMDEKYLQYNALKRELETNRTLYSTLLSKIKEQSITGESRPVNIWVVEEAKIPLKPIRPVFFLNMSLGLFLGLGFGVGGVLIAEKLDNRIKSPDGLDLIIGAPTLGSITLNRSPDAMSEIVLTSPRSLFAESYNALRTTILHSSGSTPPKRILITSSTAGEGKSTTAVNLALSLAKNGAGVLLLDGDLRKGSLHEILGLPNNFGLSTYLSGASSERAILCSGSHENLAVITCGPTPTTPYELLNSGRFALLLENLEQDFDFIICDAPPVLLVSDPRVLCKFFDGVLIVTRANMTTYSMVKKTIKMLMSVNARIIGTFLNGVSEKDHEYYKHYESYLGDISSVHEKNSH